MCARYNMIIYTMIGIVIFTLNTDTNFSPYETGNSENETKSGIGRSHTNTQQQIDGQRTDRPAPWPMKMKEAGSSQRRTEPHTDGRTNDRRSFTVSPISSNDFPASATLSLRKDLVLTDTTPAKWPYCDRRRRHSVICAKTHTHTNTQNQHLFVDNTKSRKAILLLRETHSRRLSSRHIILFCGRRFPSFLHTHSKSSAHNQNAADHIRSR